MPRCSSLVACAWTLAFGTTAWSASADESDVPVPTAAPLGDLYRVDFEAPTSCATAEIFYNDVRARTPRLRLTTDDDWTSRFEIAVRDGGDKFVGTLVVHTDHGSSEQRDVSARSCEEVLETFALIVAVAIDPSASLSRKPKPKAVEPSHAGVPEPAERPPVPRPPQRRSSPTPSKMREGRLHKAVGLGIEGRGAFANDASLAGVLSFELERDLASSGWGWGIRLGALRGLQSQIEDPFGRQARFRWTAGRIDAGPILFQAAGALSLQAALGVDLGVIEAESVLSETRVWSSALAFMRARFRPTPSLSFELESGALTPFTRDKFALFDPNTVVYRERALSGFVGLALFGRLD